MMTVIILGFVALAWMCLPIFILTKVNGLERNIGRLILISEILKAKLDGKAEQMAGPDAPEAVHSKLETANQTVQSEAQEAAAAMQEAKIMWVSPAEVSESSATKCEVGSESADFQDALDEAKAMLEEKKATETPFERPQSQPDALELLFARLGEWLAVRGEFAPKGMTHEFAFATRWLVRIGILLIVGAIIYFVKLSIDRGWMGPAGRVASILFWGTVGSFVGSMLAKKEKYSLLGHAAAALGVAALYLGFGLGHRFFDPPVIASPVVAFIALFGVTVLSGVMAVSLGSSHIAVMGLIGGYLVPVIAGRDSGFPLGLDAYLLVLNIGAFFVARKRHWPALDFLASVLAVVICSVWSVRHPCFGGRAAVLVNFLFLCVVHTLYLLGVTIGSKRRGSAGNAVVWAGLSVNSMALFAWHAAVFGKTFSGFSAGGVLLVFTAFYLAVAACAVRFGWADRPTVSILLLFAVAFGAMAPVYLLDGLWWVFAWAAIAVAVSEAERLTGQRVLGVLAWVVLAVAAAGGLLYHAPFEYCFRLSVSEIEGLSAKAFFAAALRRIVGIWVVPAAAVLVARRTRIGALAVISGILAFLFYTGEARIFGYAFLPSFGTGTVTVAWLLAAFAGLWLGIAGRRRWMRITALSLLALCVGKVLAVDTEHLATPARVTLFMLAGALFIVGAFLYMRFKDRFRDR